MYVPLRQKVSESTTREERIKHLIDYYRDFLSENLPGTDGTDFDYSVIGALVEIKREWRDGGEQLS